MELPIYVWKGEAIAEHSCTKGCLPQRHISSDSSSAIDTMHVVDDVKNNGLNDFILIILVAFWEQSVIWRLLQLMIFRPDAQSNGTRQQKYARGLCKVKIYYRDQNYRKSNQKISSIRSLFVRCTCEIKNHTA